MKAHYFLTPDKPLCGAPIKPHAPANPNCKQCKGCKQKLNAIMARAATR